VLLNQDLDRFTRRELWETAVLRAVQTAVAVAVDRPP
jgi:hypothetical protein